MGKEKCYLKLTKHSLFNTYFAFWDTEAYLADNLFIRHEVTVHFGPEYVNPESSYRLIVCHVRKRDADRAIAALEELPGKMLLCGYPDYPAFCKSMRNKLEKSKEGSVLCDADGAAG